MLNCISPVLLFRTIDQWRRSSYGEKRITRNVGFEPLLGLTPKPTIIKLCWFFYTGNTDFSFFPIFPVNIGYNACIFFFRPILYVNILDIGKVD